MARLRVGLDVGSTAVRAAELSRGADLPIVVRAAQVPLPAGAVERGEVREPQVVADALRELWGVGRFKSREVLMGVGNQRVVVREIALPFLPPKELKQSLAFQVQEFIPMPVDDVVLDYDPIAEFEQQGRQMIRILLVAAQRTMVSMLVEAASDAKLQPVGLDLIPFALVRAVGTDESTMGLEDSGGEAVVDVGAQVTTVAVHSRQVVQFVRVLPSGGHDITVAIGRALGTDNHVAERLKRGEEAGGINVEEARRVAQVALGTFVDEIRSSLDFFAQVQGSHVTRLLVTGGGSNLEGLLELMRERIPVNVERGQAFLHVRSELDLIPEALVEAETVLAAAVGLGIQGTAA